MNKRIIGTIIAAGIALGMAVAIAGPAAARIIINGT